MSTAPQKPQGIHIPLKPHRCLIALIGSAILAFGLCHVHAQSNVTEGGVLGMTLLLEHWLSLSPALTGFLLNALCYLFGWRSLGREFVGYSLVASAAFSIFYALFELIPSPFCAIAEHPLLAALVGALFVGVGVGFTVWAGGAPSGDDALAMSLSHLLKVRIQWIYLFSDLLVLSLSITYIPITRIGYSLITVVLSGQIIGWIQKIPKKENT
jgi:uncharacterized membrane-anchored protein YitT (DUF2179 family)